MFFSKRCKFCGAQIRAAWSFCPQCGAMLKEPKPFAEFEKEFGKFTFPKISLRPGRGLTITISSRSRPIKVEKPTPVMVQKEPEKVPAHIEEPETKITRVGQEQIIYIKLPDVKSPSDVQIKKLEQSIEIRARAGNKLYFKVIPIAPAAQILEKKFVDQMLRLRVAK